ncbi:hypothetical protein CFP56_043275 [Quercus suber]|uniref:Uncharacterized protein n=1 Tax=Quercus suber TaxID=58331 RepID=A0AAW0IRV3_QUESU
MHVAVRYCNFEVVKELINEKDPADLVNKAGESALFLAVERQLYDIAYHILKKSSNMLLCWKDDMNVLHALAFCTRYDKRCRRVVSPQRGTVRIHPLCLPDLLDPSH